MISILEKVILFFITRKFILTTCRQNRMFGWKFCYFYSEVFFPALSIWLSESSVNFWRGKNRKSSQHLVQKDTKNTVNVLKTLYFTFFQLFEPFFGDINYLESEWLAYFSWVKKQQFIRRWRKKKPNLVYEWRVTFPGKKIDTFDLRHRVCFL